MYAVSFYLTANGFRKLVWIQSTKLANVYAKLRVAIRNPNTSDVCLEMKDGTYTVYKN